MSLAIPPDCRNNGAWRRKQTARITSTQREPHRQPDQRAAEDFFGAASIAQRAQQKGKEEAYQAVAEIEGHTLERKYRRAPVRFDQGVQIIREEKTDGDHRRAKREGEDHAPPPPAQRQTRQCRQGNDREPGEISCGRTPLHHASRDRRNEEAERSKSRPEQTVTGGRQIDQSEVRAGERQEQSDHRVEQHAGQNHEERERHVCNPRSRGQYRLDRGFLRRLRLVVGRQTAARRFSIWFPHAEGDQERERGRDEVKINWKTQRYALREYAGNPSVLAIEFINPGS